MLWWARGTRAARYVSGRVEPDYLLAGIAEEGEEDARRMRRRRQGRNGRGKTRTATGDVGALLIERTPTLIRWPRGKGTRASQGGRAPAAAAAAGPSGAADDPPRLAGIERPRRGGASSTAGAGRGTRGEQRRKEKRAHDT